MICPNNYTKVTKVYDIQESFCFFVKRYIQPANTTFWIIKTKETSISIYNLRKNLEKESFVWR